MCPLHQGKSLCCLLLDGSRVVLESGQKAGGGCLPSEHPLWSVVKGWVEMDERGKGLGTKVCWEDQPVLFGDLRINSPNW